MTPIRLQPSSDTTTPRSQRFNIISLDDHQLGYDGLNSSIYRYWAIFTLFFSICMVLLYASGYISIFPGFIMEVEASKVVVALGIATYALTIVTGSISLIQP